MIEIQCPGTPPNPALWLEFHNGTPAELWENAGTPTRLHHADLKKLATKASFLNDDAWAAGTALPEAGRQNGAAHGHLRTSSGTQPSEAQEAWSS